MYPKIIAAGLSAKHAHHSRVLHALYKHKKHLKQLHVGKGIHHKLTDAEMNEVNHVGKVRRLVPLKIQI